MMLHWHTYSMIDIVHTINLNKREDRLLSICKQAKQQGFALKIWDGVEGDIPFKNINKAFKRVVQYAKDHNLPKIIIAEDDCVFHSFQSFDYFIKNIPEKFDLFLGMVYSAQVDDNHRILNGYSGNTLVCLHNSFYDFFLSAPNDVHMDRWCGQYAFEKLYYVCHPFVCKQLNGYSDNRRMNSTYDALLEGKEFI